MAQFDAYEADETINYPAGLLVDIAGLLQSSGSVERSVAVRGDNVDDGVDVTAFDFSLDGSFGIDFSNFDDVSSRGLYVAIRQVDSSYNTIATIDEFEIGRDAREGVPERTATSYDYDLGAGSYLVVVGLTTSLGVDYELNFAGGPVAEIPGDASTFASIAPGQSLQSAIDFSGDSDWIAINLQAGTTYDFSLSGSLSGQGTLLDPLLNLRDSAGNILATNDDREGGSFDSLIAGFTPSVSGTYYLDARAVSQTGSYTLSAQIAGGSPVVWSSDADALAVVAATYQFFTGSLPTAAGFEFLISSSANANDLNDPYYEAFNQENRFFNFSSNLGTEGEGRTTFIAEYGALSFQDSVRKAYDVIIGNQNAPDLNAALNFFFQAESYYQSVAIERMVVRPGVSLDDATKIVMIGSLLNEATKSDIGLYGDAVDLLVSDIQVDGQSSYFGQDLFGIFG